LPAALSAIRGSLAAAPVPRVLESALAANALNALADEDDPVALSARVPRGYANGGQFTGKTNPPRKKTPSGYTAAHRAKVGQRGNWKTLGLPSGKDLPCDPKTPDTDLAAARKRLKKGETVKTPFGEELHFDAETRRHLFEGRPQEKIEEKLKDLDAAKKAMERPHEIWLNERSKRKSYIRFERDGNGRRVVNAVDATGGHVYSWHSSARSFDHYREGKLLYVRP
jgi:hypothetical protein